MTRLFLQAFIFLTFLGLISTRTILQNGWKPLSKDEVLHRFNKLARRDVDKHNINPGYNHETYANAMRGLTIKQQPNFDTVNSDNMYMNTAIKLIEPAKPLTLDQRNAFYPVSPDTITSVNDLQRFIIEHEPLSEATDDNKFKLGQGDSNSSAMEYFGLKKANDSDSNLRKAKLISDFKGDNSINVDTILPVAKLGTHQDNLHKEAKVITQENRKSYQVTENPVDTLELEESNTQERTGYFYVPPNVNYTYSMANNLTQIFLDILSKHNIRPGDDLPNYTLSRRERKQNQLNGFMLIPIPIRVFPQLSHLSGDALAVLLSNFGFYLPGSYGIHSRYRNLYGYLASNNIHNNKPFGSYKIFSDTDSSN